MTSDDQGTPERGVTEAGSGGGGSGGGGNVPAGTGEGWGGAQPADPARRGEPAVPGAPLTAPGGAAPGDQQAPADDQPSTAGQDLDGQPDAGDDDQAGQHRKRSFWRELPVLIVIALVIALLIKTFVVQAFFIPSSSMEDTLLIGDKVLVNKLVYHLRKIEPGDIIVFDGAGSWDPVPPPSRPNSDPLVRLYDDTLGPLFRSLGGLFGTVPGQTDYIKRVIGVPGDRVACCNAQGLVTVNGVPLHERSYLFPGATPSQIRFSMTVPPGRLWVMGDNRGVSDDSRLHQDDPGRGTVPESAVIGRAFLIVWPPSRWRVLSIPATFGQPGIHSPRAASAAGRGAPPAVSPAVRGPAAGVRAARDRAALAAGETALTQTALTRGVPVAVTGTYLPLAGGFALAIPMTLLQRRIRLRARRRRGRR